MDPAKRLLMMALLPAAMSACADNSREGGIRGPGEKDPTVVDGISKRLERLPEIWKDQWFVSKTKDATAGADNWKTSGWLHLSGEQVSREGKKAWKLRQELQITGPGESERSVSIAEGVVRDDRTLSPLEVVVSTTILKDGKKLFGFVFELAFLETGYRVKVLEGAIPDLTAGSEKERTWSAPPEAGITLMWFCANVIERGSLERLDAIPMSLVSPYKDRTQLARTAFREECTLPHDGKDTRARRYSWIQQGPRGWEMEYWVNDDQGLLRAQMGPNLWERSDEATARGN